MHESVLLHEAITALNINAVGIYVDGTFGRGGHSSHILNKLDGKGRLVAFDKDVVAIEYGRQLFSAKDNVSFIHGSFADMRAKITELGLLGKVDGVLLDLGVSSPQLDVAERGFSFLRDGPLDMRMNQHAGMTAAEWISTASAEDIKHVLRVYGEEKWAALIAKRIVERRALQPFERTHDLADFIRGVIPTGAQEKGKHAATRSFQAIRIFINRELDDLEKLLSDITDILAVGGRLVVISFHSLEDRIVKHFIREQERGPQVPRNIPITVMNREPHLVGIGKAIKSSETEISNNVRSRSAIMRVAEKVAA